jgi:inhibitor of KinA
VAASFCYAPLVPSDGPSCSLDLRWTSDRTLLVKLGDRIDEPTRRRVAKALQALRRARLPALLDASCAYATVQITLDALALARDDALATTIEASARGALAEAFVDARERAPEPPARTVELPVCYDQTEHDGERLAPDLADVAEQTGLSVEEVIAAHSGATYRVHFLGFMPGFAYLSGLPASLHVPRRDSPRTRVPSGSVAIAGEQAGVYPASTPGGWNIIGRTPLRMFDASREEPALLRPDDSVRFAPISRERYEEILRNKAQ